MQFTTSLQDLPFFENLRTKQQEAVRLALEPSRTMLNVQAVTGYGKTRLAAAVFAALCKTERVDRLLYIVGMRQQRDQFRKDSRSDFASCGVNVPAVVDVSFSYTEAIRKNSRDTHRIFTITIQSLLAGSAGREAIVKMMRRGKWMVVVDEHHHYGEDRAFGDAVRSLPCEFVLAMSATPHRPQRDGIFGQPDITMLYRDAVEEKAAKKLILHSYVYKIDAIGQDGEIETFTTDDIAAYFGSEVRVGPNGELTGLDKAMIKRSMRWSPKYVSPLVERPIIRAQETATITGVPPQVLIKAMSVNHARLVYTQVSSMFNGDNMVVDWIATGEDGRTQEEIDAILDGFCPPKRKNGYRYPEDVKVNVLISVGLAGEGMDSTYVTEVVFLTPGNDTNQNRQTIGRASRWVKGVGVQPDGNINVDSSSFLADFYGENVMDLMDAPPGEAIPPSEPNPGEDRKITPLPEEPGLLVIDIELKEIRTEDAIEAGKIVQSDPGFRGERFDWDDLDENHPAVLRMKRVLRDHARKEAEEHDAQSAVEYWHTRVNRALSKTIGDAIEVYYRRGDVSVDKTLAGDLKRKFNQLKVREIGPIQKNVESLRLHYDWIRRQQLMVANGERVIWLV